MQDGKAINTGQYDKTEPKENKYGTGRRQAWDEKQINAARKTHKYGTDRRQIWDRKEMNTGWKGANQKQAHEDTRAMAFITHLTDFCTS